MISSEEARTKFLQEIGIFRAQLSDLAAKIDAYDLEASDVEDLEQARAVFNKLIRLSGLDWKRRAEDQA